MKKKIVLMLVAVSLMAGSAMALVVADAGFEDAGDYSIANGGSWIRLSDSASAWTDATPGIGAWIFGGGYFYGATLYPTTTHGGNNMVDVNGDILTQTITGATIGQDYRISLWGSTDVPGSVTSDVDVSVDGGTTWERTSYIQGQSRATVDEWLEVTWDFTATATSFDLSIYGAGEAYVDDVSITEIPEPMTMALLGLGGLFLRRKKR